MAIHPGAMSQLASSPPAVVVGIPGSRRVELFNAALAGLGLPPARLLPYADLLTGQASLPELVTPGALVRIESPGRDFAVERMLIVAGAAIADDPQYARIDAAAATRLVEDRGEILYVRQWYRGLRAALDLITRQLAVCPPHRPMNNPHDIALMFDKVACHAELLAAGMPVAPSLGPVGSYAELLAAMGQARCARVFIKLAHGSSASGVVAYQVSNGRHHATTTVELVPSGGTWRLYNSRRLRVYRDERQIGQLIDALCRQSVHVEQWLPKAGIDGQTFDLRVVVIGGRARHVVVRLSRSPMTNLHLLNARGDPAAVRARMDEAAWAAALGSCEAAMACFSGSHYVGFDLLIGPDYARHAILEANAFGDLLPGCLHEGQDTYTAEVLELGA